MRALPWLAGPAGTVWGWVMCCCCASAPVRRCGVLQPRRLGQGAELNTPKNVHRVAMSSACRSAGSVRARLEPAREKRRQRERACNIRCKHSMGIRISTQRAAAPSSCRLFFSWAVSCCFWTALGRIGQGAAPRRAKMARFRLVCSPGGQGRLRPQPPRRGAGRATRAASGQPAEEGTVHSNGRMDRGGQIRQSQGVDVDVYCVTL
jgi:hypothetical protein